MHALGTSKNSTLTRKKKSKDDSFVEMFFIFPVVTESGSNGAGTESFLTMEALDALGFLITGYFDGKYVNIFEVLLIKVFKKL